MHLYPHRGVIGHTVWIRRAVKQGNNYFGDPLLLLTEAWRMAKNKTYFLARTTKRLFEFTVSVEVVHSYTNKIRGLFKRSQEDALWLRDISVT